MSWRGLGVAIAVVAVVGAIVVIAAAVPAYIPQRFPPTAHSFICYRDATLSEIHVGVDRAVYNDRGVWTLFYTDGEATGATVYRQEEGESCMTIEEAP